MSLTKTVGTLTINRYLYTAVISIAANLILSILNEACRIGFVNPEAFGSNMNQPERKTCDKYEEIPHPMALSEWE